MGSGRGYAIQRLAIGICAAVVLLTGLAVGLFVHSYHGVVQEAFVERSTAYTTAFASVADAWLRAGDKGLVETTARFLLLGSAVYVQVVAGATVLIDERTPGSASLDLLPAPVQIVGSAVEQHRLEDGSRFLDVIVPTALSTAADRGPGSGYVRIGVDASTVGERLRAMALITSGIGVAFDGLVVGFVLWLVRHFLRREVQRKKAERTADGLDDRSATIVRGPLRIDEAAKCVSLFGKDVSLPPKQYALLRLLASDPLHVFSDKEILAAVWSTSSYADSKDVKQQVYLLRRRLADVTPEASKLVVNVPGFGYRLVPQNVDEHLTER